MSTKVTIKITWPTLYSIGHGNRDSETLLALLQDQGIKFLADVRSYPSSKRNPHFNQENLQRAFNEAGISYTWLPELGGFRRTGLGNSSPHVALKRPGFRNYADFMATEPFRGGVDKLRRCAQRTLSHQLSPLATVIEGRLIYNRSEPQQLELKTNDESQKS
jgi:uncharacterized protein (DUF488 family)